MTKTDLIHQLYVLEKQDPVRKIGSSEDLLPLLLKERKARTEHFVLFCLNGGNRLISKHVVFKGGMTASLVDPKVIFHLALKKGAAAIIVAHNHPSGAVEPSQEDKGVTRRLEDGCKILGICFLDHIIVGKGGHSSWLRDNRWGMVEQERRMEKILAG